MGPKRRRAFDSDDSTPTLSSDITPIGSVGSTPEPSSSSHRPLTRVPMDFPSPSSAEAVGSSRTGNQPSSRSSVSAPRRLNRKRPRYVDYSSSSSASGSGTPLRSDFETDDDPAAADTMARPDNGTTAVSMPAAVPAGRMPRRNGSVVDLTAASEDEAESDNDVVYVRGNATAPAAPPPPPLAFDLGPDHAARRRVQENDIEQLDRILADRRQQLHAIQIQEAERRREVLSPPPGVPIAAAARQPIRLGGAVLQRGDRQVRFQPGQSREHVHIRRRNSPGPEARALIDQARWGDVPPVPPIPPLANFPAPPARAADRRLEGLMNRIFDHGGQFGRRALNDVRAVMGGFGFGYANMADMLMAAEGAANAGGMDGVAGPARAGLPNIPAVIASIPKFEAKKPLPGFTENFDLSASQPIVIDDKGAVVKTKPKQPYLSCFNCHQRLRLSSNYRDESDRVWTLRCGHLLDQRCLSQLSTPQTEKEKDSVVPPLNVLPVLDAEPPRKKSNRRKKLSAQRARSASPHEFFWKCPAKGCGREHTSVQMLKTDSWKQRAGEGAMQVFM